MSYVLPIVFLYACRYMGDRKKQVPRPQLKVPFCIPCVNPDSFSVINVKGFHGCLGVDPGLIRRVVLSSPNHWLFRTPVRPPPKCLSYFCGTKFKKKSLG